MSPRCDLRLAVFSALARACRARLFIVAVLAICALGAGGCTEDEKPDILLPPPPAALPFPGSADTLMANFRTSYGNLDLEEYGSVLAPQYEFILNPSDVPQGQGDRLERAQELEIAQNMFSGQALEKPDGSTVPGISAISIAALNQASAWSDTGPTDPDFPNTQRALFQVQLAFSRPDANTIIVSGQQVFYVTSRDSTVNGVVRPYYQLRGQRDLTLTSAKIDEQSWSKLKLLFR